MKNLIPIFVLLMVFSACKKDPQSVYSGKGGISFTYNRLTGADSLAYSFKFNPVPKERDTLWLGMRLTGHLSDKDRKVSVVASPLSTAVAGVHYILPEVLLPANANETKYPLVLINSADLSAKEVFIILQINENEDFTPGPVGVFAEDLHHTSAYKINFSNMLTMPIYWTSIRTYFGVYSRVKYQFMIETLGIHDYRTVLRGGTIPHDGVLVNMKGKLIIALAAYVAKNGPLIDEVGSRVTFPL